MQIIPWETAVQEPWAQRQRAAAAVETRRASEVVVRAVLQQGDDAVRRYTQAFDGVLLESLVQPVPSIASIASELSPALRQAIDTARANIERFHSSQSNIEEAVVVQPGVTCWRRREPIDAVGLYVPGGKAPLLSTALMLLVPAAVAGCRRRVLCTPPQSDGSIPLPIRYVAALCGVTELVAVGGAQAIAALAYGTESIAPVDKIFGPGNAYVTAAKQLVSADGVAIDVPAGPSEVLVVADDSAPVAFVSAELQAQAEHGADSLAVLVTDSPQLANAVQADVEACIANTQDDDIRRSLRAARAVVVPDLDQAIHTANDFAPEHLVLMTQTNAALAQRVTAAGSVFLGPYSPVAAGDYATGTNHTLPTSGAAAAWSGLSLESFQTCIEFQELTREGLEQLAPTIETLAQAEGLEAHARSVQVRTQSIAAGRST